MGRIVLPVKTKNPENHTCENTVLSQQKFSGFYFIYSRTQQLSQKCTFCGKDPSHRT